MKNIKLFCLKISFPSPHDKFCTFLGEVGAVAQTNIFSSEFSIRKQNSNYFRDNFN